jgi:hypothetical protein
VPVHTSHAVLTDLLRGRLSFTGTVVSDDNGIGWAQTRQLVASSAEEVGAPGVSAPPTGVTQPALPPTLSASPESPCGRPIATQRLD